MENSSPRNYRKKHPSSSMLEVRWSHSMSQGCQSFSHFPLRNTSLYKSSLNQDCYSLYSCKIRHFSIWWKSQKKNKPEGKTPTYITPDLKYHGSHQTLPTPHTHLAWSSGFAFIPFHPHQPPRPPFFFFTFVIAFSSTPQQKPLRNKKVLLKSLK